MTGEELIDYDGRDPERAAAFIEDALNNGYEIQCWNSWLNPGDVFTVDKGLGAKRYICLEYVNDGGFVKAIREDVDKSLLGNEYRCVWQNIEDCESLEVSDGHFLLNYEEAKKYLNVPGFVIDKDWWLEDRTVYLPSNKKGADPLFCLSAKNIPHCIRLAKTFDADKLVNRVKKV